MLKNNYPKQEGRRGRDRMYMDLQPHVQSTHITTKVVSSIHTHGEVY